jgi:DNA-binding NarL/FixJ family response regulator
MTEEVVRVNPSGGGRPLRVLVVDDHAMVREALVGLLGMLPGVVVCGEAGSVDTGYTSARTQRPDIVLVDLMLAGRNGLDLVRALVGEAPVVRTVVVSMKDEGAMTEQARSAGASGYIMKDCLTEELAPALEALRAGLTWFPRTGR